MNNIELAAQTANTKKPKPKKDLALLNLSVPSELKVWANDHAQNTYHSLSQLVVKLLVQERERVDSENAMKQAMQKIELEMLEEMKQYRLQKMIAQEPCNH